MNIYEYIFIGLNRLEGREGGKGEEWELFSGRVSYLTYFRGRSMKWLQTAFYSGTQCIP